MLTWSARLAVGSAFLLLASFVAVTEARADGPDGGFWGRARCGNQPKPGCSVETGSPARAGSPARTNGRGSPDPCSYRRMEPSKDIEAALGGRPKGRGAWYTRVCRVHRLGGAVGFDASPIWLAAPPAVSPEALAAEAASRLVLPDVVIRVSPAGDQLVGLPTWLWVDGSSWRSVSATASVPGASVTATARPVRVTWSLGDGSEVVCRGPGTPWRRGVDPRAASPDCGHRYVRSSASQPGSGYLVRVSVAWAVSWAGAGSSGVVPGLATNASTRLRVAESQAVLP